MNKRQKPSQKMKGATVAAVLCFVAAIAIVGTYTFNDYKRTQQKAELARVEEDRTKDEETKEPAEEANNLVVKNQDEPEEPEEPEEPDDPPVLPLAVPALLDVVDVDAVPAFAIVSPALRI